MHPTDAIPIPAEMTAGAPDLPASTNLVAGPRRVHLIGVAGSGMSGIAGLLLALGHRVSGSDRVSTAEVERLQGEGLEFHCPPTAEAVGGAEMVIFSSAIKPGNPAFDAAVQLGLPRLRRAEALAQLLGAKRGIVIAGTHGKTTTSAMAAHVLRAAGLRPCHYVGAETPILGTNAHWDPAGEFFVAEGDESDGTLALYRPEHAILLNIEEEHLDFYADLAAIETVFRRLCDQTRGTVFYCLDDPNAARLGGGFPGAISFGEDARADYRFANLRTERFQSRFDAYHRGELLGTAELGVPGRHNVSNALSVIALCNELSVQFITVTKALATFRGARRRFESKHRGRDFSVLDDYGHHPSEVRATLATARAGHPKPGRVVAVFQPHRYSRTQLLREQFGQAFDDADVVLVTDVYAASESPLPGVSGQTIVDALARHVHPGVIYEPSFQRLRARAGSLLQPGDLLLSLGAGNIHEVSTALVGDLQHAEALRELLGTGAEGEVKLYEPLSRHTTLRVGGPAQFWVEPTTEAASGRLVRYAREHGLPVFVIGRGSNLLVRDGGIAGLVIHPVRGEFARLEVDAPAGEITAGVGVGLKRLAAAAAKAGIGGFEWMDGIPGAVGGGLRMNAGAMGVETFDQVVRLRFLDVEGRVHERPPAELEVHYREVPTLRTNYALAATFKGFPSTPEDIARGLAASLHKRKSSQPIAASAGCIFKNPSKEIPAGKLIQELGLKNRAVGAARVSEVHGNFIVNDGQASAGEVLALIDQVKEVAWRERGIRMETEVQIVGHD